MRIHISMPFWRRNGRESNNQGNCKENVHSQFHGQAALAELLGLPENVKPYSIVGIGYPAEDADLEVVDRFDVRRIHYNKY